MNPMSEYDGLDVIGIALFCISTLVAKYRRNSEFNSNGFGQ